MCKRRSPFLPSSIYDWLTPLPHAPHVSVF